MNENMSYYLFMRKQILVINALNIATAPGYLLIGYIYTSMFYESLWMVGVILITLYGHIQYMSFHNDMNNDQKRSWAVKVKWFMFVYSSMWTFMFVYYVSFENIDMHYVTMATQLGASVVAATLLASQKKLFVFTVASLMLPIFLYFLYIQTTYGYLLAFFTVVLCMVLLYAAKNTNDYIAKSSYQAYHDHLTQLGNRRLFLEILEGSVKHDGDRHMYLLLIDLDYFKTINDTLGHDTGDLLLQEVANRIKFVSDKHHHIPARLGGDEFCVLSNRFNSKRECEDSADLFANELLAEIKKTYNIGSNHLYISASIGVSFMHEVEVEANQFLKEADMAMYEAKLTGRDGIIVFSDDLSDAVTNKLNVERLLYHSLQNDEISLVYQPQVGEDRSIVGCEVLARWNSKELGPVKTDLFIEMAEKTGFILEIGEYILDQALHTLKSWSDNGIQLQQFSINISMRQLLHQSFVAMVKRLFEEYKTKDIGTKIYFEITETSTAEDTATIIESMNKLKALGVYFSIDDFGTGYSSLSYLRDIPLDELKIDQSFVAKLSDEKQAAVVKTIIDISKNLDLKIVAEGVEEEYQKEFLKQYKCDIYQGYLFSKPISKKDFENLIAT